MTDGVRRIVVVVGTRAEAVKLAPVVHALQRAPQTQPVLVCSGQHGALVDPFLEHFGLRPHVRLKPVAAGDDLPAMTSRFLGLLSDVVRRVAPAMVIVQGDTTTTLAGALAGFYQGVPVAHVEAGLRSGDLASPYPEEGNRRVVTQLAALHLAPTHLNRANLRAEGVCDAAIVTVGNTVIDSFLGAMAEPRQEHGGLPDRRPVVLLTAHRRESWGPPMEQVALGVADAARARPDALIVWPLHPNPAIDQAVRPAVRGLANVRLVRPAGYCEFVDLVRRADVIVTDSGGVQEEGAYLGKRLLVLRDVTERPEAVDAGIATLVGTDRSAVADAIVRAVASERGGPSYRYGDGCAGSRAVAAVAHYFGDGPRPADFVSGVYPALSPV